MTDILFSVFYPKSKGTQIPLRRYDHGLVLNVDCFAVYRFSTGEELTCRSGDCIFLPKGSSYTAARYPESLTERRGVYAISFLTLEEKEHAPLVIRAKGQGEILSLFSKSAQAWRRREVGYREECFADLYAILRLLKREQEGDEPKKKARERIEPAVSYMNSHYTEESISVDFLASLCKVSQPYFRRLFQSVFGASPAIYMRNLRIDYARELLSTGEYSVTDAAMLSGFNDAAYFSREFKKKFGVSPCQHKNMP